MIAREVSYECLSSETPPHRHDDRKFDYAALDSGTRLLAQEHAREIKSLLRQSADHVFQIGQSLIDVKQSLPHGYFRRWLDSEFSWSESMARKFMQVARQFKSVKITDLNITPTALYALAKQSVPDLARDEAIARARQGEIIEPGIVKEIISRHNRVKPVKERITVTEMDNSQTVNVDAEIVREAELTEQIAELQMNCPAFTNGSSKQMISVLLNSNSDSNDRSMVGNLLDNYSPTSNAIQPAVEGYTRERLSTEVAEPNTPELADADVTGISVAISAKSISYEQIADSLAAIAHCMQLKTSDLADPASEDTLVSIVERSQFLTESAKCLLEQKHFQH